MIEFDASTHTYSDGGIIVPSVTQVLRPIVMREYAGVSQAVLDAAAALGRATHKMIELDIAGTLDDDSLDDALVPYLDQWREFCEQGKFRPLLSETRVYSRKYKFAGTLDLLGDLDGALALVDCKRTAQVPRAAGPQTAGYEIALRETMPDAAWASQQIKRYALHLTPMHWQLVPFRDQNDSRVFLSALSLFQWENKK